MAYISCSAHVCIEPEIVTCLQIYQVAWLVCLQTQLIIPLFEEQTGSRRMILRPEGQEERYVINEFWDQNGGSS